MPTIADARQQIVDQIVDGPPNSITPSKMRQVMLDVIDAVDAAKPDLDDVPVIDDLVAGPDESVAGQLALFDGTSGKLLKAGPAISAHQWLKADADGVLTAIDPRALSSDDYDTIAAMVAAAQAAGISDCWVEPAAIYEIPATININGVHLRARKTGQLLRFTPPTKLTRGFWQTSGNTTGCGISGFKIEANDLTTYAIDLGGTNARIIGNEILNKAVLDTNELAYCINIAATAVRPLVAGNFIHSALILIRTISEARNVMIVDNTLDKYRNKGINILTPLTEKLVQGPTLIARNRVGAGYPADPAVTSSAKQPIAVNQQGGGVTFARNVHIHGNLLQFDRNTPHKSGVVNTGVADAISFQRTIDGSMMHNSVLDGGEVGLNLSLNCENIVIGYNFVERSDLCGINVGSGLAGENCRNISVIGNHVNDCGLDQLDEVDSTYACGVRVHNSSDCYIVGNSLAASTPPLRFINAATQANPVVITTSVAHGYTSGQVVLIKNVAGMSQLNNNRYLVTVLTDTTFSLATLDGTDVDGTGFGAYVSGGTSYQGDRSYGIFVSDGLRVVERANSIIGATVAQVGFNGTSSFDWTESAYTSAALPPLTTAARGSIIWNITTIRPNVWNGGAWRVLVDETTLAARITGSWKHHGTHTVAALPTAGVAPGDTAYASNGRKDGEGVGAGTGVQVFRDGSNWIAVDSGTPVAA